MIISTYSQLNEYVAAKNNGVFPKIDDSGNVDNKGLRREEQNKFSQKKLPPVGIELGTPLVAHWHCL